MKLLKNTILASVFTALLPVASFAQTTEEVQPAATLAEVASYQNNANEEIDSSELDDSLLSWGGYLLSLGHEDQEETAHTRLFHALTNDFVKQYGIQPKNASLEQLREYYAKHSGDYAGELLLPTMAVWKNYPMMSIIPLPDRLEEYWEKPEQAAKTYNFLASINHADTIELVGSYMGSFYGHPTKQKVLKNFWKKWAGLTAYPMARQDIVALKRQMLLEILSHDAQYAVYELASKELDLWPQLKSSSPTEEELVGVQNLISSTCLENDPTEDCARLVKYATEDKYFINAAEEVGKKLNEIYYQTNVNIIVGDDIYDYSWFTARRWRVRTCFRPFFDPWHPYYYWLEAGYVDGFCGFYLYNRWIAYPGFWLRPPVWRFHHNHPTIIRGFHHGRWIGRNRPPHMRPNRPHSSTGIGGGRHGHGPGSRYHNQHPGQRPNGGGIGSGRRPGGHDRPNMGGQPGSNGRPGGHGRPSSNGRPGGNGRPGHDNHGNGGNGRPGHDNHGNGGNGGPGHDNHGNGGNGGPGHDNHGNGGVTGGNPNPNHGGGITGGTSRPNFKTDKEAHKGTPTNIEKQAGTRVNPGSRMDDNRPKTNSGFGGRSTTPTTSGSGSVRTNPSSTTTPSTINRGNIEKATKAPVRSQSSFGTNHGSNRPSGGYTAPTRSTGSSSGNSGRPSGSYSTPRSSSGGSFGGSSRSSGGSFGGSSRSSGGSFGGSGRSSGGFSGGHSSGGSHGGSSSGSHGSSHGGRR